MLVGTPLTLVGIAHARWYRSRSLVPLTLVGTAHARWYRSRSLVSLTLVGTDDCVRVVFVWEKTGVPEENPPAELVLTNLVIPVSQSSNGVCSVNLVILYMVTLYGQSIWSVNMVSQSGMSIWSVNMVSQSIWSVDWVGRSGQSIY